MQFAQTRLASLLLLDMKIMDQPAGKHSGDDGHRAGPVHAPASAACGRGGRVKQFGGGDEIQAHVLLIASAEQRSTRARLLDRHMAVVSHNEQALMKLDCDDRTAMASERLVVIMC